MSRKEKKYCHRNKKSNGELWGAIKEKTTSGDSNANRGLLEAYRNENRGPWSTPKITRKSLGWDKAPQKTWWHAARCMQGLGAHRKAHRGLGGTPKHKGPCCPPKGL